MEALRLMQRAAAVQIPFDNDPLRSILDMHRPGSTTGYGASPRLVRRPL
jgi:hypothetical protein